MIHTLTYNAMQVLFAMVFAPFYSGVLSRLKEIVQSRRGPTLFQPHWDIWKLFQNDELVSDNATWTWSVPSAGHRLSPRI